MQSREDATVYKHIMLPYSGSEPSLRAEKECIALARSLGARVTVFHVVRRRRLPIEDAVSNELVKELEETYDIGAKRSAWSMLAEVEKCVRASGVECSSMVVFGHEPYKEIISNAAGRGCDLVVMASRRRTILEAMMSGSDTDKVLARSTIPVLVVR
jgi:nucleotide-binding universal stress UspA family protein